MGKIIATPNQSYLCKNMEFKIAAALAVLLVDLGYNVHEDSDAYNTQPNNTSYWPSGWRINNQYFHLRPFGDRQWPTVDLIFKNARWDGEQSKFDYGKETLDHQVVESDEGKTKIVENETNDKLHIAYEEEEELTNSFSSSITKGVTLDMTQTKDASVDSTTTVSGEYAGFKAETSLAAHFGISQSKSESKSSELGKEKSEEGTKKASIAIEFDAKALSNYMVQITKKNEQTRQPFSIDGVMDFDFMIKANHEYWQESRNRHYRPGGKGNINLIGIEGLIQFVFGYDTNFPSMQNYWNNAPDQVKRAVDWIQDAKNRRIQVSGVSLASLDSNAHYDIKPLGSTIPSELSHLPVIDGRDVAA